MYEESKGLILESEQIKNKQYLYLGLKRLFDIIVSGICLLLLIPLFIIVGIIIKIDSKGPIILKQIRVGKDGKPFKIYKFRSMVDHAEEMLEKLMQEDAAIYEEYTINKKLKNDPRITRVGKIIRRTSIDELPQLLNVFNGDMSLVGPRPYFYSEIRDMSIHYFDVIQMTPGLTGLWQISGRSDINFKDRCKIDSRYLHIRGIKKDLEIIFKTFGAVFSKKGAK